MLPEFLLHYLLNVVRVNRFFDPACVPIRITINKLYFVPKLDVSDVVSVF